MKGWILKGEVMRLEIGVELSADTKRCKVRL